jgi:hypothetical protein
MRDAGEQVRVAQETDKPQVEERGAETASGKSETDIHCRLPSHRRR